MKQLPIKENIIKDVYNQILAKSFSKNPDYTTDPMKLDSLVRELLEKELHSKVQIKNTEEYVSAIKTELLKNRLVREGKSLGKIKMVIKDAEGAEARFGGVGSSHK